MQHPQSSTAPRQAPAGTGHRQGGAPQRYSEVTPGLLPGAGAGLGNGRGAAGCGLTFCRWSAAQKKERNTPLTTSAKQWGVSSPPKPPPEPNPAQELPWGALRASLSWEGTLGNHHGAGIYPLLIPPATLHPKLLGFPYPMGSPKYKLLHIGEFPQPQGLTLPQGLGGSWSCCRWSSGESCHGDQSGGQHRALRTH